MTIEHLHFFLITANSPSINAAAKKLYLSQQHLNRIISELEKEWGVKLFERQKTGVLLTSAGKELLGYAENTLDAYKQLEKRLLDLHAPEAQALDGSCNIELPIFCSLFLNDLLDQFKALYPEITLHCTEYVKALTPEEILSANSLFLFSDSINASLFSSGELTTQLVFRSESLACTSLQFIPAIPNTISEAEYRSLSQTAYPQNSSTDFQDKNLLFISSNIHNHMQSVLKNNSVCAIPSYAVASLKNLYPDIQVLHYRPQFFCAHYITHPKAHQLTDADATLITFLANYFTKKSGVRK